MKENEQHNNTGIWVDHQSENNLPQEYGAQDEHLKPKQKKRYLHQLVTMLNNTEDQAQRRIGNGLIKFLALLLILTLVSRGTSGATMARVDVTTVMRNEIVDAVTGTATVSVRESIDIVLPDGLTITEIFIGVGQSVKSGEALAIIDISEIRQRLIRENAALDKLLLELAKLERSVDTDASTVENARKSLLRAQEDYLAAKEQGEKEIAEAIKALDEVKKKQMEKPDQTQVDTALKNLRRAEEDYDIVEIQGQADITAAEIALQNAIASGDPIEIDKAQAAVDAETKKAADNLLNAKRKLEDAKTAYNKAQEDYIKSQQQALASKDAEIVRANEAVENAKKKAADSLLLAERRVEDAQSSLAKAESDHAKNLQQSSDTVESNNISAVTLRLDIENQKQIVDTLIRLEQTNGIIYAEITGVISSVKPQGSLTGKDATISFSDKDKGYEAYLLLDKSDAEMLSVGDECKVTTGGGTLYYNPTVDGYISSVSPENEKGRVGVTIRLPEGNWKDGQRVSVQTVLERNTYDMCIPISALHSDSYGYFVYAVTTKTTVLGIENVVVKVPVMLITSDSDYAAISGPLERTTRIILGSNSSVKDGDRVRIND